ncbi:MAG TPA: choice-of-anchor tandem repeat GloVer-containing protein [Terriglobia bacterium]|nr:choice-of-anchor tandem repeat GloVer-containing protein [Terriglobia bacterium]
MSKLNWVKTAYGASLLCATTAIALPAQTLETLRRFDGTNGAAPEAALIQGTDGNLYGTTYDGGANNGGTVFKMSPGGALTALYSFCAQTNCADGGEPYGALVQSTDGNLYGTTVGGGANDKCYLGCGTVFTITPSGTLTTLYSFCSQTDCADGEGPFAGLVQASDGNFYGTTTGGGASKNGTVFKITPGGALFTLYSFCSQSNCADGLGPVAGLTQAADGDFYGTTSGGGTSSACAAFSLGCGTIFKITPRGTLTTLHSFDLTDGFYPSGRLVQAPDGNLYGTASGGGASGGGTVFRITAGGGGTGSTFTMLYSFCAQTNCTDGVDPIAGLVQATDGNFYGTTSHGGAYDSGTVFEVNPGNGSGSALTTLHTFCAQLGCPDGSIPFAALLQDTDGNLYGTTADGGNIGVCGYGCGTVFSLALGLAPFVETQPAFGKAGKTIEILGTNLTGATSVTFNGTPAAFTVEASSVIKATVPAGATTGTVQLVTPGGTLSSSVPFTVLKWGRPR